MKKELILTGFLLTLASCATVYTPQARDVKRKPKVNGVIALNTTHRDEDRQKADSMMKQNCGTLPINIVEEGEVAVGQQTSSSGSETNRDDSRMQVGSMFGIPLLTGENGGKNTNQSSTVTQLKEWQISYECQTQTQKAKR